MTTPDPFSAERAELLGALRRALAALNLPPRHTYAGVDTYAVAAELNALLRRYGAHKGH